VWLYVVRKVFAGECVFATVGTSAPLDYWLGDAAGTSTTPATRQNPARSADAFPCTGNWKTFMTRGGGDNYHP